MQEFLQQLQSFFEKAYVYVPTIMAVITGIGIPALTSIAKIVSSSKSYLQSAKTLKETVDVITSTCQQLIDVIANDYVEELKELELEKSLTYNKRMQELIDTKIARKKELVEKYNNLKVKDLINYALEQLNAPKKKVKVRVKTTETE